MPKLIKIPNYDKSSRFYLTLLEKFGIEIERFTVFGQTLEMPIEFDHWRYIVIYEIEKDFEIYRHF